MVTLGVDASTSTIGYGAVDEQKNIIDLGFLNIGKIERDKDKAFTFIEAIAKKPWINDVVKINVEASLSGFANGKTSQQVIIKLSRWNAVFCYILEEYYKMPINLNNATTMRKALFGKARVKSMKPKDFVKTNIELSFNVKPWLVLNRNGVPDVRMADAYDGLVAAFY
jgi:Holliday junction resolvasome RuvABC endonuclease subunit